MKEGWKYKKLGEIASYINGFPFKPSDWRNEGKPIIRIQNLTGSQSTHNRCDRKDIPSKYNVELGDILISWSATLGVYEWKSESAFLNQHIFKVVFDKENINKYYFKYAIQNSIGEMSHHTNGATMKHIRKGDFDNIEIPVPPISEQHSIVSRLDAVFTRIDNLKSNAEQQLAEARDLFYRVLFEKMRPKEGWNKYTIADICKSATYGTSSPSNDNGRYKYLRMNNINTDGSLNLNNLKTIDIPDKELEKYLVRKGDLLFNRTNSPELVGKSCVFDREEEMIIAGYIIRIRFKDGFDPYFVCYFINLQRQIGNLKPLIVGAVHQANISATAIKSLEIHCPPLAEQKLIVSQLDVLSVNVRKMEDILHKTQTECDALKQAMLKEVFE